MKVMEASEGTADILDPALHHRTGLIDPVRPANGANRLDLNRVVGAHSLTTSGRSGCFAVRLRVACVNLVEDFKAVVVVPLLAG
jgi:hypothetical protein